MLCNYPNLSYPKYIHYSRTFFISLWISFLDSGMKTPPATRRIIPMTANKTTQQIALQILGMFNPRCVFRLSYLLWQTLASSCHMIPTTELTAVVSLVIVAQMVLSFPMSRVQKHIGHPPYIKSDTLPSVDWGLNILHNHGQGRPNSDKAPYPGSASTRLNRPLSLSSAPTPLLSPHLLRTFRRSTFGTTFPF